MEYKPQPPADPKINVTDPTGLNGFLYYSGLFVLLFVLLFLALKVLQWSSPYLISREVEKKIFSSPHPFFKKIGFETSPTLTNVVKELEPEKDIEAYIIDLGAENAFCFFGDRVFVSKQLIENAESENELVFVLAHELGHVEHRHVIKSASFNLFFTMILSSFGSFGSGLSQMTVLKNSRDYERQADLYALSRVKNKYGHTHGADTFFKRLTKESKSLKFLDSIEGYISTHPTGNERIDFIKNWDKSEESQEPKIISRKDSEIIKALQLELKKDSKSKKL